MFKVKPKPQNPGATGKSFNEDKEDDAIDFKNLILNELKENKTLLKMGDGGSSSGSDSAPSEDNLAATELIKNLPVADKTLKAKIKTEN
jgi:hypothetical protein